MIFGVGCDLVKIDRMTDSLERFGDKFAKHILSATEQQEFQQTKQKSSFLAKRFAAKEAFVKALGTGLRHGAHLTEIEIGHYDSGQPMIICYGETLETLSQKNISHTHLSISDEKDYAMAYVILEAA